MNLTIFETESLLKAEYQVFEHSATGKRSIACQEYSVPIAIRSHIDYITPTVESTVVAREEKRNPSAAVRKHFSNLTKATGLAAPSIPHSSGTHPHLASRGPGVNWLASDLDYCADYLTRVCVQAMYNIPDGTLDL
jgi:tripeptidyl-peptidase-1